MSKKTIIIFISVFAITGMIILGVFMFLNKDKTTTEGETPWYQNFNPFGASTNTDTNIKTPTVDNNQNQNEEIPTETSISKFFQITDFAISGATFFEEEVPIKTDPSVEQQPKQITTTISAETKEGRKEIQTFLNKALSLNPPLVVDGNFGKKVTEAVKAFQKQNNLSVTGKIDAETAPLFTKTTQSTGPVQEFETVPFLSFVEKMNGHIYKMSLNTKTKDKISNSTIPNIYEAFFDNTSKTVVYRYLSAENTINSFLATLGEIKGEFLPEDIYDFSTNTDKTKFFYLTKNNNGATGVLGTFGNTKKETVFSSPFTEWISDWDGNQRIFLTTKPSYGVAGSMFMLNTSNKTITKVFGSIAGLTTKINNAGSVVLFSSFTEKGPVLGVFNINEHTTKDLSTYGLPEKCTWAKDNIYIYCAVPNTIVGNQYPDSWYQGLTSFDDYFVKINTQTGDKETIANSANETPVDGTKLFLNNKEETLFFINKKDSTLWSLDLR